MMKNEFEIKVYDFLAYDDIVDLIGDYCEESYIDYYSCDRYFDTRDHNKIINSVDIFIFWEENKDSNSELMQFNSFEEWFAYAEAKGYYRPVDSDYILITGPDDEWQSVIDMLNDLGLDYKEL